MPSRVPLRACSGSSCWSTSGRWSPLGPRIFDVSGNARCITRPPRRGLLGPSTRAGHPPLEHDEEAVVQFLDAGCLPLPMRFQECAASRLDRQKTGKDEERVLEYHRHALAATHFVPSCAGALLPFRRRTSSSSFSCGQFRFADG